MIDWSRLHAPREGQWKSFENVCYQLAVAEFRRIGTFTSIDDSGGGDGVEFFLTLPGGAEWGWQAKFYHPNPRLHSSRRRSVLDSLERSLERHPRLERWFLCTPGSFTPTGRRSELRWWEDLQARYPGVELVHWNDRELSRMLAHVPNVGIRNAFFGDLALGPEWFRDRLDAQLANLRDRYDPDLHTETEADFRLHCLAHDPVWRHGFAHPESVVRRALASLEDDWAAVEALPASEPLQSAATDLLTTAEGAVGVVAELAANPEEHRGDGRSRAQAAMHQLGAAEQLYIRAVMGAFAPGLLDSPAPGAHGVEPNSLQRLMQPAHWAVEIIRHMHLVVQLFEDAELPAMHLFGAAGVGKTHTAAHACEVAVRSGRPALLLHGTRFHRSSSLESEILDQVQLGGVCTWDEFVGSLEAYAAATRSPAFIVIDALNEAEPPTLWRQTLPGLLRSLAGHPHVRVVTTCRPSYASTVWGEAPEAPW